jgi:hypothetical protein
VLFVDYTVKVQKMPFLKESEVLGCGVTVMNCRKPAMEQAQKS